MEALRRVLCGWMWVGPSVSIELAAQQEVSVGLGIVGPCGSLELGCRGTLTRYCEFHKKYGVDLGGGRGYLALSTWLL